MNSSVIKAPPLPSNLAGENNEPVFNSIGYYSSLMNRLDNQISTVENVYKQSFFAAQQQMQENDIYRGETRLGMSASARSSPARTTYGL